MDDLVRNHILDRLTGGLEILTRIEMIRMLHKVLADVGRHGQADIRVDIDLADSELRSLTQLVFRDTDSIRHVAAVLIDHLYELLRNGRRSVKNDREARQSLDALFQNVETQRRRYEDAFLVSCALSRCELVSAMRSTDSDSKRVAACALYEFFYFIRTCVALLAGFDDDFVLYACERSELSFDAIPISLAKPKIEELMNQETKKKVKEEEQGVIGIQGISVSAEDTMKYGIPQGVYVYETISGGGAEKAGIEKGDVIVKFDGTEIGSMEELHSKLRYYAVGTSVNITILRPNGNQYDTIDVKVQLSNKNIGSSEDDDSHAESDSASDDEKEGTGG